MMRKVDIQPHTEAKPIITVMLKDYWYRSAGGFGVYTQAISENTYRRVAGASKLYYLSDDDGKKYKLKPQRVGVGYFFIIKPT